jgi:hypothetical protein
MRFRLFVCLFFTLRFSILCFLLFCFCFLVDTDATAGVGPRGLLNNVSDSGVSELDGSYRRSLDAARHGAYCTARAAVGNENEANAAQQEQCRQRARCRRRQQRQICNIANSVFESAAVYSQLAPVVLLGEIFIYIYIYITIRLTSICETKACQIDDVDRDVLASALAIPRIFLANALKQTRPLEYCASSQQVIVVRVLNVSDA